MSAMNACTSGRSIPGLTQRHEPCGYALRPIGYTTKKQLPVEACPRCDALPQKTTS